MYMYHCTDMHVLRKCAYFDIRCDISNKLLSADSGSSLPGLRLQLNQLSPHVLGGTCEVPNLSISVQSKHLGSVGQRKSVYVV